MTTTDTLEPRTTLPPPLKLRSGIDLRALWTLYTLTLRQHLRGKRWIVILFLFLIPIVLAIVARVTNPDAPDMFVEFTLAYLFIPQALLPLIALMYASGVIQDELEEQTITYLLIRPIRRWALYTVKMLAAITTTVVMTILFTALTYSAIYFRNPQPHPDIFQRFVETAAIHSLAVIAYCCLFGFISLLTKRALVVGILYTALVEGLLANLPLSVRMITVIYYTRIIAYRTMSFTGMQPQGPFDIANDTWQLDVEHDPYLLEHPQRATCIAILLIASLVLTMLGAFLCSRKEFYVKTPEKS